MLHEIHWPLRESPFALICLFGLTLAMEKPGVPGGTLTIKVRDRRHCAHFSSSRPRRSALFATGLGV
jgi:hypothetical protein